ncbi:hypothetical protein BV96_01769 [Sphingomonas paucimobilis]|nr:hypothetical protein BV96_01769 [Sphingomonas paucimobilis]
MSVTYEFDCWSDAPEGYRWPLKNIVDGDWLPLEDAVVRVHQFAAAEYQTTVRDMLVWRLANGLIASKAGILEIQFSGSADVGICRQIPLVSEWRSEAWTAAVSDVWTGGDMVVIEHRAGDTQRCHYKGISVFAADIERFVDHLASIDAGREDIRLPLKTGDPGRPTKGKEIYMAEFERRIAEEASIGGLMEEARSLAAWYSEHYPLNAQPTPKTVKNSIAARWRKHKADSAGAAQ